MTPLVHAPVSVSKFGSGNETLRCLQCGEKFLRRRSTAVFCSARCRLTLWRHERRVRKRIEYYSPREVVAAARALFGGIDLDPASCPAANEVVRAARFYTIRDNGLEQPWFGNIWINPPFPWKPWVPKLLREWQSGNVEQIVALATTRVTTALCFVPLVSSCTAVLKMRGRLRFWGPSAKKSPDEGHELFYFGPDVAGFERHFSPFGKIFLQRRGHPEASVDEGGAP